MRPGNSRWTAIARALFGVGLLAALFYYVDPASVVPVLGQLQPLWIAAAAGMIVSATLLGAFNLLLLFPNENLTFRAFIPMYWTSWAIGLVVPGQVGDVASITALLHRRGYPWRVVLGRSLLDKILSFGVLAGFALAGLSQRLALGTVVAMGAGGVFFAVGGFVVLARWRSATKSGRGGIVARLRELADAVVGEIRTCATEIPLRIAANLGLTIVKVLLTGASYWAMFRALGYAELPLLNVVFLAAASSLVAYVPISFNGIGTVEAAGLVLFNSLGLAATAVLAAYLSLRVTVMVLAWVPAAVWLALPRKEAAHGSLR